MKYRVLLVSLFLCLLASYVSGQEISCGGVVPDSQRAFQEGEKLRFGVKYSASIFNISVADVDFHTTKERYFGKQSFRINAVARTKPFFNMFFKMEDTYDSWLVPETLRPMKASCNIEEGSYRFKSFIVFNWKKYQASTSGRNLRSGASSKKTLSISDCSADALTMFYMLRSADLSKMREGNEKVLNLVFEDTLHNVRLKYLGRDVISVDGMGDQVKSLKFTCQLASTDGEGYDGGDEFLIWLSDDRNRIPLYLESPIRVGKVFAKIEAWEGLKYPLDCVVTN